MKLPNLFKVCDYAEAKEMANDSSAFTVDGTFPCKAR